MDNKTRVSFRVDVETKEQLKKIAKSHGLTLSSYLSYIATKITEQYIYTISNDHIEPYSNINKTDND